MELVERVFAIAFLVSVLVSAIVGTINPTPTSWLWKLVNIFDYISYRNPRGVKTISWEEYKKLKNKDKTRCGGNCKCKKDEEDEEDN